MRASQKPDISRAGQASLATLNVPVLLGLLAGRKAPSIALEDRAEFEAGRSASISNPESPA